MYETLMSTFHQQNINKMKMVQFPLLSLNKLLCHRSRDYLSVYDLSFSLKANSILITWDSEKREI